jgi:hypothetical protein
VCVDVCVGVCVSVCVCTLECGQFASEYMNALSLGTLMVLGYHGQTSNDKYFFVNILTGL